MTRVALAFGSNLGDRSARILAGVAGCAEHGLQLLTFSRLFETSPVGGPAGQGNYLNAAGIFEARLDAMVVLRILQAVESEQGRVRSERDAARTLDIDLLLFGQEIRNEPNLTVPHPRLRERLFVLYPLADVAPNAVFPGTQRTIDELLDERIAQTPDPGSQIWLYNPA